ncbi:N-acetylglutamate kinase [Cyclobacterium xiamenense]|uniref:Acetylglutamate kinase n=1 Tax=Cyclobacterium xiamenense TaxID=1297121 RepID=A0A1H7AI04_9BACT|nr:acetylglutamate kinase [Cyclobacterium xiamenense]SEJ65261.1 N-acetylglutamate kinase [Cyclobacterium xiamenense]
MQYRKILIKYGGNAMINEALKEAISQKIKILQEQGTQVILVHGGGPFINKSLEEAGIKTEFFDGHRHTTVEALRCIEKTLKGEVNSSLVNLLNKQGLKAVGLSGKDGQLAIAEKRWHIVKDKSGVDSRQDLGQVGDVQVVNPLLPDLLLENGFTPVVTCIASDTAGNDYNINGDVFAGKIAASLQVDAYIVLTDVDGLYRDYPDPASILKTLKVEDLEEYMGTVIQGGMIPKIESCLTALKGGVKKAVILNGTQPEQITDYIVNHHSIGTTITH